MCIVISAHHYSRCSERIDPSDLKPLFLLSLLNIFILQLIEYGKGISEKRLQQESIVVF